MEKIKFDRMKELGEYSKAREVTKHGSKSTT